MMKYGLALGGGGAKGAYQIGVYKALLEFNQIKKIKAMSGTSIGAVNLGMLCLNKIDDAKDIWNSLSINDVVTPKSIFEHIFSKDFALLNRSGMDKIVDTFDYDLISSSKLDLYVTATNIDLDIGEVFKINNKDKSFIKSCINASSAIPKVFPVVKINNYKYVDGWKYLNVPIKPLVEESKCNFIFAVPLSMYLAPKEGLYPNATIIDFNEPEFDKLNYINGTLAFSQKYIKSRIALGYSNAHKLLSYLQKIGVITVTRKDKFRYFINLITAKTKKFKKYYSLEDIK